MAVFLYWHDCKLTKLEAFWCNNLEPDCSGSSRSYKASYLLSGSDMWRLLASFSILCVSKSLAFDQTIRRDNMHRVLLFFFFFWFHPIHSWCNLVSTVFSCSRNLPGRMAAKKLENLVGICFLIYQLLANFILMFWEMWVFLTYIYIWFCRLLEHNYIGSGHLLLAFISDGRCLAHLVLAKLGVNASNIRTTEVKPKKRGAAFE